MIQGLGMRDGQGGRQGGGVGGQRLAMVSIFHLIHPHIVCPHGLQPQLQNPSCLPDAQVV
eukprot:356004-Chlamydomonas_euryale.AAC.2